MVIASYFLTTNVALKRQLPEYKQFITSYWLNIMTFLHQSDDFRINPKADDLFTRLIDLRDEAKANNDSIEKTLKIIANSTSYGIFIEVNRDNAPKSELLNVYGPNNVGFSTKTKAVEEPGRYFHPLLGVLITGAARLMLGIAEKKTIDFGLDWAFCDTDSLAIVKPDEMPRHAFHKVFATQALSPPKDYRK